MKIKTSSPDAIIDYMETNKPTFLADISYNINYGAMNGCLSVSIYGGATENGAKYILFKDAGEQ